MNQTNKETYQNRILAMHEEGFTAREIYEEVGCAYGTVYSILSKYRLKANERHCPHCGQKYNPNLL